MDVTVTTVESITVVAMDGELTGQTSPDVQRRILDAAKPGCKMILDFSKVTYMGTAGFRLLLVVHRTIVGSGGKVLLVGLSENIKDHLTATGFLDMYPHRENVSAAIVVMNGT